MPALEHEPVHEAQSGLPPASGLQHPALPSPQHSMSGTVRDLNAVKIGNMPVHLACATQGITRNHQNARDGTTRLVKPNPKTHKIRNQRR